MHLGMIVQPAMAIFFAIRDGAEDAREGLPPYFWSLCTDPAHRHYLLKSGWKSVEKVFILALILDAVYQVIVLRWFHPGEALVVALFLAIVLHVLFRGLVDRLILWGKSKG